MNETRQDMTFLNQSTILFSNNNSPDINTKKAIFDSRNQILNQDTTDKEIGIKSETKNL